MPDRAVTTSRSLVTLALLATVAALSYIDRQVFTVLMESIKADLALNDTVLGLLSGASFALFYVIAAFPLARYSDRGDRPLVVAACVSVWSAATALSGLAVNAWHLAIARIGVASAEAGGGPASLSLLTEIFPRERRTMILGVMLSANSIGISGGLAIGGWLALHFEWRTVFIIVGLPGLIVGLLVWLFCAEPRRARAARGEPPITGPRLGDVVRTIVASPSLRWVALMLLCVPITGFGFLMWSPSFFQRVHHLSIAETGAWLGGATLLGLVAGNLFAGWVGDRFGKGDPSFNGKFAAVGLVASFPFAVGFALSASATVSLLCFVGVKFLMTLHLAPIQALCFAQVPITMRAMMSATIGMVITLAGVGLGTAIVGALSDGLRETWGEESLRYSLLLVSGGLLLGAIGAWRAGVTAKPIHQD